MKTERCLCCSHTRIEGLHSTARAVTLASLFLKGLFGFIGCFISDNTSHPFPSSHPPLPTPTLPLTPSPSPPPYFHRAGLLDVAIAFNLSTYLLNETDYVPWKTALYIMNTFQNALSNTSISNLYQVCDLIILDCTCICDHVIHTHTHSHAQHT